ncbi:MAG: hypothetical protein ING84_18875 [Cytophagales bacterium]|jgi:hypothetical protein|nr:hypothetical protein [Cytophagales bacterium]MCA6369072.1 hypothetical protein [Cytophagales bacterium]MCA6373517.1 hypothetical protein [Cytophagales bacterium]MCA6377351.1 hypothetical protein [Cytophagales bacterium]MCA6385368.1 hypothetical protein [Cytophagales bacterium]
MITPIFKYNPPLMYLVDNAFKVRDNRLFVRSKFVRSLLYCKPGKPSLKFVYLDISELPEQTYHELFDIGDEDKIIEYIKERDEKEISRKEAKENFKQAVIKLINEAVRCYYNYLPDYDYLRDRSTTSTQLFAVENALMMFAYNYRQFITDIAPIIAEAKIQVNGSTQFLLDRKKLKMWKDWFLTHTPHYIPNILLSLPTQQRIYSGQIMIPDTTKDLIELFYLRARPKRSHCVTYFQLLTNFVIDNPHLDKTKVFIIDTDRINTDVIWTGLEDIEVNEEKLCVTRARVEQELGLKVYLPFEQICFAVYRFELSGLDEDNCNTWSYENYILVYDHSTKFVIYRACLTGEPSDFEQAVRAVIEPTLKIPISILIDPSLSSYLEECRELIERLRLPVQIQNCNNFRLSHFLNFYTTSKDKLHRYDIVQKSEANSYLVNIQLERNYKESVSSFGELVLDEFNSFDDLGSSNSSFRSTPKDCFTKMKKGFSREMPRSEFAQLYFSKVDAISEGTTCRFKLAEFIMDYQLASDCYGKGVALINPNVIESEVFFLTNSGQIVEAKYRAKLVYEGGGWEDYIGCSALKIIDVRNESNRLVRKELGIPEPDVSNLGAQLEKSRVRRKRFKRLMEMTNG